MELLPCSRNAVQRAARVLRSGGIVAFPTETVYGLGAAAFDPEAVARVFEAKERPRFDPLIVHLDGPGGMAAVAIPDERAHRLAEAFWPGPLTLVLPRLDELPGIVTAGLTTVAVRSPDHPCALALIQAFGGPIAAPSANRFGSVSPTTAGHVVAGFGDRVDLVLDGGPCAIGVESTIVDLVGPPRILRPGGLPVEEIERVLGEAVPLAGDANRPTAPGQLPRHYAPSYPLTLLGPGDAPPPTGGRRFGYLSFGGGANPEGYVTISLSESGSLAEAAHRLFAALREMEREGVERVYAAAVPETGLGLAIMDRLRRASRRDG